MALTAAGVVARPGLASDLPPPAAPPALMPDQLAAGRRLLDTYPSVDIHAHPGRFFVRGLAPNTVLARVIPPPEEERAASDLHAGKVSAALFSGVADMVLLGVTKTGGLQSTREFLPGEAWAEYVRQIGALKTFAKDPRLARGKSVADIDRARRKDRTACIFSIEGGDFIEDRLDRVGRAHGAGVRAVTIVHYHVNALGDIQTASPVHGGLTGLGKQVVREMNRTGIVVDLAHASFETTRGAVEASQRPVILSHSNLQNPASPNARLITPEHARLIAGTGGMIGSVPSGINQASVSDWIDSIFRLVDVVGIDHVGVGTDMDSNFRPVFTSYRDWALIPAMLLARGMGESEAAAVMGGNFLRVFAANHKKGN